MARSRVLSSVVRGLLGTYSSRNSDVGGYWLFGLFVADLSELRIDLLGSLKQQSTPTAPGENLAILRFHEQLQKAGLEISRVKEAALTLKRLPGAASGFVNGRFRPGFQIQIIATATSHTCRSYHAECTIFAAPHDPTIEQRSARVYLVPPRGPPHNEPTVA